MCYREEQRAIPLPGLTPGVSWLDFYEQQKPERGIIISRYNVIVEHGRSEHGAHLVNTEALAEIGLMRILA